MRYYLSVEHKDLRRRKQRWQEEKRLGDLRPATRQVDLGATPEHDAGLIAAVDENGMVEHALPAWGPQGLLFYDGQLLVASPYSVNAVSSDLRTATELVSAPWCNDLHSLRQSRRGILVAASGVDAVVEFTTEGTVVWTWCAIEHGFPTAWSGEPRSLDLSRDHRGWEYATSSHTTHVNSAIEVDDETIVATLFHQGRLVAIDRDSGRCVTMLDGLRRPHAVRIVDNERLSLADTGHGRALLLRRQGPRRVEIEAEIDAGTSWLQDAFFDGRNWLLVDGAESTVKHVDAHGRTFRFDSFDPDWRLYEALPVRAPHEDNDGAADRQGR